MITHQISVLADFSILLTFFFWTLDIRPSVVLLLRIVLIQLLVAKPNKSSCGLVCVVV